MNINSWSNLFLLPTPFSLTWHPSVAWFYNQWKVVTDCKCTVTGRIMQQEDWNFVFYFLLLFMWSSPHFYSLTSRTLFVCFSTHWWHIPCTFICHSSSYTVTNWLPGKANSHSKGENLMSPVGIGPFWSRCLYCSDYLWWMRISVQIQLRAPTQPTLVYLLDTLYPSLVKEFKVSVQTNRFPNDVSW